MAEAVKRRYDNSRRLAQVRATRLSVIEAARSLFIERGYPATTLETVADTADVALPTLYRLFGSKRALLKAVLDTSFGGDDEPIAFGDRPEQRRAHTEPDPASLVRSFARICRLFMERSSKMFHVMSTAAQVDPEIAELQNDIRRQRHAGQARIVAAIANRDVLDPELSLSEAEDIAYAALSPEVHRILTVERSWTADQYESWLIRVLSSLLRAPCAVADEDLSDQRSLQQVIRADGSAGLGAESSHTVLSCLEAAMCTDHSPPAPMPAVLHDVEVKQPITLEPVDSVEIVAVMDNITDVFMPDQGPARRAGPPQRHRTSSVMAGEQTLDPLIAEHGFSALVTVRKGQAEHRVLFDAGVSPDGVVENMRRLDIDPGSIEAIVCSHGHFDHTGGIEGLIRAVGRPNMPVLIHPHFWRRRRVRFPGIEPQEIPSVSKRALEDAGFEVIEEAQPSFLLNGSVLVTGEVARTSGYEPGFPPQDAWLDGAWEPDPLVLDEQALMINVRGKGLVVLTGCGHAGIVNICRYARRLTRDLPLYAAMGGFHLNGPLFEPLIPRVLDDLAEMAPQVLVPAHCTGWRAQHAMGRRFSDAFVPNTVGTHFTL